VSEKNTNSPKVTVVTVTFNCLKDAEKTVCNVLGQDYSELEYIAVDGASTDGTLEFLTEHKESLILHSEPDDGIYYAMNKAIELATGEFIIFMNAGDVFATKTAVSDAMQYLEEDTDFLYGDRYRVETDGVASYQKAGPVEDTLLREVVYHQALFTKLELLKAGGYNTYLSLAADYEFVVKSWANGRVFSYAPIAICRFACGGKSRQQNIKGMIEALKVSLDHTPLEQWRDSDFFRYYITNNAGSVFGGFAREFKNKFPHAASRLFVEDGLPKLVTSSEDEFIEYIFNQVLSSLSELAPVVEQPTSVEGGYRPKITVVTVVYHDMAGVLKTIKNVLSQTYDNIEYIVIDGGSSDGTVESIRNYESSLSLFISEPDSGIYDAMNKGINAATGDYVLFMNAGDIFTSPQVIANVVAKIGNMPDVIYGDRNYVSLDGSFVHQPAKPIETVFEKMPYCHQSAFVKRSVLKEYPFNLTYHFAADYNQVLDLYTAGCTFQYIPMTIADFLEGGRSESGIRPYLEVIKIQYDHADENFKPENSVYLNGLIRDIDKLV